MARGDVRGVYRTRLIQARENRGLTRDDVAHILGVSISFAYRVEAGIRNPSFDVMTRWSRLLGVGLDAFRYDDDTSKAA